MIQLNYREERLLYKQIKEEIRTIVISYAFSGEERLPSVGELASKLAVNPKTVAAVYRELEQEGYVRFEEGKGDCAIAGKDLENWQKNELLQEFDRVVDQLCILSVKPEELVKRVTELTKGEKSFDRSE